MKTASAALQAALLPSAGNDAYTFIEFFEVTFESGVVLRLTDAMMNCEYGGQIYYTYQVNSQAGIKRGDIQQKMGINDPDQLEIEIYTDGGDMADLGLSIGEAATAGLLDMATVQIRRAVYTGGIGAWPVQTAPFVIGESVDIFDGYVAEVDSRRTVVKLTCNTPIALLQLSWPNKVHQASCRWTLFDAGCTLNRASYPNWVQVEAGPASYTQFNIDYNPPSGWYDLGYCTFYSGVNNGLTRPVTSSINLAQTYHDTIMYDHPLGYWHLDEPPGSLYATDYSGNGLTATAQYVGMLGAGGGLLPNGTSPYSCAFNGDYVTLPVPNPVLTYGYAGGISIEMWLFPTAGGIDLISGLFTTTLGLPWGFMVFLGSVQWWPAAPQFSFPLNANWYNHAVFIFRGQQQLDFYWNGQPYLGLAAQGSGAVNWQSLWLGTVFASPFNEVNYWHGFMNHVAVYNYPLSTQQILDHYNQAYTANTGAFGMQITLGRALPYVPEAGDDMLFYPGCDKMQHTCTYKFGNLIHFGGEPFKPQPEVVI